MTEAQTDEGRMTLVEHLTELRHRVIVSAAVFVVFTILVFAFYSHLLHFLSGPYEQVTRGKKACGAESATQGCKLIATGPLEPLLVRIKVSTYGGLALSVPFIFWQIWRFVTPGLRRNERRYGVSFLIAIVVLFALGGTVAWFTVEKALEFLLGAGGSGIQPFITADKYLTLVTLMIAAFGVAFELPVLLIFLLLVRAVTTRQLRNIRRWMIVGIVTFAAFITPSSDPFSLFFMAVPMYLFYEIAIVIGRVMKR
ncbi:MAG: sec-independent protein translocase protein TatC [Actinomycetota bacterium]|jgi:sec-independent protein translocase protein TatC|nr:sec-independent protein translocase protein TatC [Actinomycetota bacterium]